MTKNHKIIIAAIGFFLTATLYVNLFPSYPTLSAFPDEQKVEKSSLNNNELKEGIQKGIEWIKNSQNNSGYFKNEYLPFLNKYIDQSSIILQAETTFLLGELAVMDTQNTLNLKSTLQKSVNYLKKSSITDSNEEFSISCLKKEQKKCSTDGTSLALLSMLNLVEAYPELEESLAENIEGYKNFLITMKKEKEGFRSQFIIDLEEGEYQQDNENAKTNGQAWLALIRYSKYKPWEKRVSEIVTNAYSYFENTYYGESFDNEFYSWAMAAITELYKQDPKSRYADYVKTYTDWRIKMLKDQKSVSLNRCYYVEGLIDGYLVLKENIPRLERKKYQEEIDFWIAHSDELQIKEDDQIMLTYQDGEEKVVDLADPEKAVGGFLNNRSHQTQRADTTSHCINAYFKNLVNIEGEKL